MRILYLLLIGCGGGTVSVVPMLILMQAANTLGIREVVGIASVMVVALTAAVVSMFWLLWNEWKAGLKKQLLLKTTMDAHNALLSALPEILEQNRIASEKHAAALDGLVKSLGGEVQKMEESREGL